MIHRGGCHCGRVAFEAEGEITSALSCNCSICARRGSLLWFVPAESFRLLSAAEDLAEYRFNRHAIGHRFCPVCGIHVFGEGVDREGNDVRAVNIRCLEDIDLDSIPVQRFDGRSL